MSLKVWDAGNLGTIKCDCFLITEQERHPYSWKQGQKGRDQEPLCLLGPLSLFLLPATRASPRVYGDPGAKAATRALGPSLLHTQGSQQEASMLSSSHAPREAGSCPSTLLPPSMGEEGKQLVHPCTSPDREEKEQAPPDGSPTGARSASSTADPDTAGWISGHPSASGALGKAPKPPPGLCCTPLLPAPYSKSRLGHSQSSLNKAHQSMHALVGAPRLLWEPGNQRDGPGPPS